MEPKANKTWYITGTSTGIGLQLIEILLNNGHQVSAITRYPEKTLEELKKRGVDNIDNLYAIKTDITNDSSVKESVEKTINRFGKIDVVVNNTGYGLIAAVEELTDEEVQQIFKVNVFGVYSVLRYTVPYLREQGSGLIVNVSSILGSASLDGGKYSAYESTKHALNAITIALHDELKPFNVNVVLFCPGAIRNSFYVGDNFTVPKNSIKEYDTLSLINAIKADAPNSTSSCEKVAQVLYNLSTTKSTELPKQLYLGSDSLEWIKSTLNKEIQEINKNEIITKSTDN